MVEKKDEPLSEELQEEGKALVPTTVNGSAIVPSTWLSEHHPNSAVCTFDVTTDAGRIKLVNIVLGSATPAEEMVNVPFCLQHLVFTSYMRLDEESGEELPSIRTHMITPDGKVVQTSSPYVRRALETIHSLVRPAPWNPPVAVMIVKQKSLKGRTFYNLQVFTE